MGQKHKAHEKQSNEKGQEEIPFCLCPVTPLDPLEDIMETEKEKEHLEKRFGVLAVEKGYVTPDEVIEALKIQVMEDVEKGNHRPIGVILLEKGLITTSQLIDVLEIMGKNPEELP